MRIIAVLILTITMCLSLRAQQIDSTISKKKFGMINCKYLKSKLEDGRVKYIAMIYFQNSDYTTITDLRYIFIDDKAILDEFIVDVNKIVVSPNKKGQSITISKKDYTLAIYDFAQDVYIYDNKRKGTFTSKNNLAKVLDWLKTVNIPE